jgi:hypothetical protein
MIRSGWRIARESVHLLLEGTPTNLDSARVQRELLAAAATVQIKLVACAEEDCAPGRWLLAKVLQFTVRNRYSMPPVGGLFSQNSYYDRRYRALPDQPAR